jgi:hypothetical protein
LISIIYTSTNQPVSIICNGGMKMNLATIQTVCVVGSGSMGHQIGMLCALGGYQTFIQDVNEADL